MSVVRGPRSADVDDATERKTILLSGRGRIPKICIEFRSAFLFATKKAELAKRVLDEYRKMNH